MTVHQCPPPHLHTPDGHWQRELCWADEERDNVLGVVHRRTVQRRRRRPRTLRPTPTRQATPGGADVNTCTARLTLADGTVLDCVDTPGDGHEPRHRHDAVSKVAWRDDTPGAYHVVECDECYGSGEVPWDDGYATWQGECTDCDGTGFVDPPLPIGIGRVLRNHEDQDWIIAWSGAGYFRVVVGGRRDHLSQLVSKGDVGPGRPWQVVRRVWPAP